MSAEKGQGVQPNDSLVIEMDAYASDNTLISTSVIGISDYYENLHPLLDSDEFRRQSGVRKIKARRYGDNAHLDSYWITTYDISGAFLESRTWNADGSLDVHSCAPDGSITHIRTEASRVDDNPQDFQYHLEL